LTIEKVGSSCGCWREIRQKLIQTQRYGEAMKRRLEGEITHLIQDKDRLQEELKQQHFAPPKT
jgi:hypothetical protein